jgi:hypothetical protein
MAAANPIKAMPMPIAINQSNAWANFSILRGEPQRGHTKVRVLIRLLQSGHGSLAMLLLAIP